MTISMGARLQLLFLFLLGFSCFISAQESSPLSLLAKFPGCAQTCLLKEFATQICSPTDKACICTNSHFQSGVTACVTHNCNVIEALATKNISTTNCGLPIRDRGPHYYSLSYIIIILSAVFVFARFGFKIFDGLKLELDDWTILATLVVGTACTAATIGGTIKHGLGKDLWTLEPKEITTMLLYFDVVASLYFSSLTLLKLSIILFYIKIFPSEGAQRLLKGTAAFTLVWGITYVIIAIFQCHPISYFWNKWDGLHKGTCLNINVITSSNAGISIVLDFWSLGIPLWQLRGLRMHWKKKISVALMFGVGTFVTIVSILRLQALVHFAKSTNVSWEFYDVSMWSTIELGVGVMCTCLPTMRLLFVRLFPVLGGSSNRSQEQYQNRKSDNELKIMSSGGKVRRLGAVVQSNRWRGSTAQSNDDEIVVKSTYTVKHSQSDGDDISLVEKNAGGL